MTSAPDAHDAWRQERSRNAAHQAAELDRKRAQESAAARVLIAAFVEEAKAQGVPTAKLVARSYGGGSTYRTDLEGWYLRKNHSVAVGTDGEFYILSVQGSFLAKLRGAQVCPSDPPLVLGQGARDGESIDLREALDRALRATT